MGIFKYILFYIFIIFIKPELKENLINNKYFNIIPNISNKKYSHKTNDNLYFVFSMFRHGVRAPMDKELENSMDILGGKWNKKAELTKTGRKQHYNIGISNNLRYSGFININYDPKEIIIYSTNTNRTITSAQSQLLGLFNGLSNINKTNLDLINNKELDIKLNSIIPPIYLFSDKKNFNTNLFCNRSINKFETTLKYSKYCKPM